MVPYAVPGGVCISAADDFGGLGSTHHICMCDHGYYCVSGCGELRTAETSSKLSLKCARIPPTKAPTSPPKLHPCLDGSNDCNHDGGQCYRAVGTAAGWRCGCKPSYRCLAGCNDDDLPHHCLAPNVTIPASASPTSMPTVARSAPTKAPTKASSGSSALPTAARTVGAQQLELTFPGELAGLSAADQSSLKADIKAAVAKASAAITEADIADVTLRAGSIVATVTFKPAVSAAAAQQAATTIAAAPVQVSVGTTTLRSTAAQAKQNAAPGLSRVRASRLAPRLHRAACGHCAFQLNCAHGVYLWQAVSDDKAGDSQAATMLDHFISMTGMTGDVSIAVTIMCPPFMMTTVLWL